MRLLRFRLTIRRLMILVVVVSIPLGLGIELKKRRDRYRSLADVHKARMVEHMEIHSGPFMFNREANLDDRLSGYHDQLAHKYEDAARYPWIWLPPDPPPPE